MTSTTTSSSSDDDGVKRKVEIIRLKKKIEALATFLPDQILEKDLKSFSEMDDFVGVLMICDVSGFTVLTEKYTKSGKRGIRKLTATLNAFIGALVDVIYFYGGDILKFSGDAFLAIWVVDIEKNSTYSVLHQVIDCALFIQKYLGSFETEVNVLLNVKLAISCGNLNFSVIGNEKAKHYVVFGSAVNDVKMAELASASGDIVVGVQGWSHLIPNKYHHIELKDGFRKIIDCDYSYFGKNRESQRKFDEMEKVVESICAKHLNHRQKISMERRFEQTSIDSEIIQDFVATLPKRKCVSEAPAKCCANDLMPFVIKPVVEQINGNQPIEYLTEMREITTQFINIVPISYNNTKDVIKMVNCALLKVSDIINELQGIVNKISLFDKDVMILVLFGLKGIKHERESQDALRSGYRIKKEISRLENVKTVSVGITFGTAYCGIVGHPFRREYTVIGATVNKAARMMCSFTNKVTCDLNTYQMSKMPSYYFMIQPSLKLKGIKDSGNIFEFNETCGSSVIQDLKIETVLFGREEDLNICRLIIEEPEKVFDNYGVCFIGATKSGKTALLKQLLIDTTKEGYCATYLELMTASKLTPYFTVSMIYKQLYDIKTKMESKVLNLPRNLWNINELMQERMNDTHTTYDKSRKSLIIRLFSDMIEASTKLTVLIIDEIQNIDWKSFDVLKYVLQNNVNVRLICAGSFDKETSHLRWKLGRTNKIYMIELELWNSKHIPAVVCQMLKVKGARVKLIKLLQKCCDNRPGWMESCLLYLVNKGGIVIRIISKAKDLDFNEFIFPFFNIENEDETFFRVADILENFSDDTADLTLKAISLDLFDFFSPFEQLIIKTASVLGETFTRYLLKVMLDFPSEETFKLAIKKLFEEDIFDCGTKYVVSQGAITKPLVCLCYMEDGELPDDVTTIVEIKYIYCKNLHFKNKMLKGVAYELLPNNQKEELHLRVTDVLENQNNSCPYCLRGGFCQIIRFPKFKEVIDNCNESQSIYETKKEESLEPKEDLKEIIRLIVKKGIDGGREDDDEIVVRKRQQWDPSLCFCLEINSRVYYDLIEHSERAEHMGKKVFFLIQYGFLLQILQEPRDSVVPLNEASEICMIDADLGDARNTFITEKLRKIFVGKAQVLLGNSYIMLNEYQRAKSHLMIALRQYDVPLTIVSSNALFAIFNRFVLPTPIRNRNITMSRQEHMLRADLGQCLNLLSFVYFNEANFKLAISTAKKSLSLLCDANPNIITLCDTFANNCDLYNHFKDFHTFERLEKNSCKELLSIYSLGTVVIDDYALCRLMLVFFKIYQMQGILTKTITMGFRSAYMNNLLQAYKIQEYVVPCLASALVKNLRIKEAVNVAQTFLKWSEKFDDNGIIYYYLFCTEMIVESGFACESLEKCEQYAEKYFESNPKRTSFTEVELTFISYLYLYYVRMENWSSASKWKNLIRMNENIDNNNNFNGVRYALIHLQVKLIILVTNLERKKKHIELDFIKVELNFKECKKLVKNWKSFLPRFYLLKAYYLTIKNGRRVSRLAKYYVHKVIRLAKKNGSLLEKNWAERNLKVWQDEGRAATFAPGNVTLPWDKSNDYTLNQWIMVLYTLPIVQSDS